MDKIEALHEKTDYWDYKHPCFFVNEERLDIIVNRIRPDINSIGLIPTLLSVLKQSIEPEEFRIAWERVLPKNNYSIFPVLMCPDDIGFDCTLIVVEVIVDEENVTWNRIGLDQSTSPDGDVEWVGTEVEWFSEAPSFEFHMTDYISMIEKFKDDLPRKQ